MIPDGGPLALAEIGSRLDHLLAGSTAESTEISWLEVRRGQESGGKGRRDGRESFERSILVRVREGGRTGIHRTAAAGLSELESAVRAAMAQARLALPSPPPLAPPDFAAPVPGPGSPEGIALCDPELARMTPVRARELAASVGSGAGGAAGKGESCRFGWAEGRLAVAGTLGGQNGLRRAAALTSCWLEVVCGRQPGAGRAAAAARSLLRLDPQQVRERARQRHGPADVVAPPAEPTPLLLAQEAAAALVELLNRQALRSDAFHSGLSCLLDRLGEQVFHPAIHLRDDPTDPRGLPLPFDLLGAAARPLDMIAGGRALTPAIDDRLARRLGRAPTAQRTAPDEAAAGHLFLLPGEAAGDDLLRAAEGGLWISALDPLEAFDPRTLRFRAVARGVRQVRGGALAASLPDLIWEDDLPALLNRVLAVGSDLVTVASGCGLLSATTAPRLAVVRGPGPLRVAVD
jgi:predicted Zn-dependent protease